LQGSATGAEAATVQEFITIDQKLDQNRLIDRVGKEIAQIISIIPIPHAPVVDHLRFIGDDLGEYSVSKA